MNRYQVTINAMVWDVDASAPHTAVDRALCLYEGIGCESTGLGDNSVTPRKKRTLNVDDHLNIRVTCIAKNIPPQPKPTPEILSPKEGGQ